MCPVCQGSVPVADRGRPRIYCSNGCRAVADAEVRRIEKQLERFDGVALLHRERLAGLRGASGYCPCNDKAAHLAFIESEASALTDRLRFLRGGGSGE